MTETHPPYLKSFRALNDREQQAISSLDGKDKLSKGFPWWRADDMEVSYEFMQGGFCVCIIFLYEPVSKRSLRLVEAIFRGASRRSYKDPRNTVKGEMQVFCRALECSRGVEI